MLSRHRSFFEQLTAFANYLREHSYAVGIEDVAAAMNGLVKINLGERAEFISMLKTVFSSSKKEWIDFEEHYFNFIKEHQRGVNSKIKELPKANQGRKRKDREPRVRQIQHIKNWLYKANAETLDVPFYSGSVSDDFADLSIYDLDQSDELQMAIKSLVRALLIQKKHRKKHHPRRGEIDLALLARNRFFHGDELIKLPYLYRPKIKTKLILLCDVSRSMQLYAEFLRLFIYHLHRGFTYQQTFVFNTHLYRLGQQGRNSWDEITAGFEAIPGLWSGGTRIGASIAQFLDERPKWLDRHTKIIIFSDAWDTGELSLLKHSMHTLKKIAGQIIWLNPVLKNSAAAKVVGMQVVKPFIDLLAPCYNLETLVALRKRLSRSAGPMFKLNEDEELVL